MFWQYRTILFEFHKDGLLGDKYVDDEEVEKVLNEQGEQGWELVSVTTVHEGLLSFFKQIRLQPKNQKISRDTQSVEPVSAAPQKPPSVSPPQFKKATPQEGYPPRAEEQRPMVPKKKTSGIDEIKIS